MHADALACSHASVMTVAHMIFMQAKAMTMIMTMNITKTMRVE